MSYEADLFDKHHLATLIIPRRPTHQMLTALLVANVDALVDEATQPYEFFDYPAPDQPMGLAVYEYGLITPADSGLAIANQARRNTEDGWQKLSLRLTNLALENVPPELFNRRIGTLLVTEPTS